MTAPLNAKTNRCINAKVKVTGSLGDASLVSGLVGTLVAYSKAGKHALVRFARSDLLGRCIGHSGFGETDNGFRSEGQDCWYVALSELKVVDDKKKAPRKPRSNTRQAAVLAHLLSGKTLTQGEAILLGYGTRLAVSIDRLREAGHNIKTTMKRDIHGIPYGEYSLVKRDVFGTKKAA